MLVAPRGEREAKPRAGRWWRATQLGAAGLLLLVIAVFGVQLAQFYWSALACPYEVEYGEGILLLGAMQSARGQEVYNNYHQYPYTVATYPPVYPLLCALGVKLFGLGFTWGRLLSILAALGTGALIWAMLRRSGAGVFAAGLGAVLFVAAPMTSRWAVVMRVDMVAVFFGAAGLYCVLRGGRWLYLAAAMLLLAAYTRQSQVGPLAAGLVYLFWAGQRRQALALGAGWAVLAAAGYALMQVVSHGWFYQHVIVANMNAWEKERLIEVWAWTYPIWRWPFLLGAVGMLCSLAAPIPRWEGDRATQPERLFLLYAVFALLLSVTAGKVGSYVNYMLEPVAAMSLMSGVAARRISLLLASPRWRLVGVAAWLLAVTPPALALGQLHRPVYQGYVFSIPLTVEAGDRVAPLLRRARGDILSEDTGMVIMTGHRLLLDPHKMSSMCRDGRWDQRPLVADIKRQRFTYIITTWDPRTAGLDRWGCYGWYRWTKAMGDAIKGHYRVVLYAGGRAAGEASPGNLYVLAPAREGRAGGKPSP